MKSWVRTVGLLLVIAAGVTLAYGLTSSIPQSRSTDAAASAALPKDIYPETGNRFPAVNRDSLDDAAKKIYDAGGNAAAVNYGPQRLRLYTGGAEVFSSGLNDFLRRKSGLEPQVVELSILAAVREMDGEFEWTAHEPAALKAGVSPQVIDIVKYRKPLTGISEKEAAIIELGREAVGKHKVSSQTFARAHTILGDRDLMNVVCLMGDYVSTAVLLNTFDQHVRPNEKPLLPIP
ncbi:MAG TPA: carboxymuconolactone decarboxylase family protein [Candidatus Acidoferrales bacterium]|nr:carboxymuconolactone decarboxylase family protein [Candidatus Acidoferrales bacterium]